MKLFQKFLERQSQPTAGVNSSYPQWRKLENSRITSKEDCESTMADTLHIY